MDSIDSTSHRPLANLSNHRSSEAHFNIADSNVRDTLNGDIHDVRAKSPHKDSTVCKMPTAVHVDSDGITSPPSRMFKDFDFPSAYKSPKSPKDNTEEFHFSHVDSPKPSAESTSAPESKPQLVEKPQAIPRVRPTSVVETVEKKENVPEAGTQSTKLNVKEMSDMFRPKSEVIERAQSSHAAAIKKRANRDPARRNTRTFGGTVKANNYSTFTKFTDFTIHFRCSTVYIPSRFSNTRR